MIPLAILLAFTLFGCSEVHRSLAKRGSEQGSEQEETAAATQSLDPKQLKAKLVSILATKGVNTKSDTGATLLHYAAYNNSITTIDFLLNQPGIAINPVTSKNKSTPLHAAALGCYPTAASKLLAHADTDDSLLNSDGQTAYQLASSLGCTNPAAFKR